MKKSKKTEVTRRQILKAGLYGGVALLMPWKFNLTNAQAAALESARATLSDPALQPKFVNDVPNALDPGFLYTKNSNGVYRVGVGPTTQWTGLMRGNSRVMTDLFGYGQNGNYTWPGKTFEVRRRNRDVNVRWLNQLGNRHILPVDTSLHWAYSHGGSIRRFGIPIIVHVHGGHSDARYDGNPEWWYNSAFDRFGPSWAAEGVTPSTLFKYDRDVPAGNIWYHDHALGITRLNVYAGMAGFFIIRDEFDPGNIPSLQGPSDLGLPKFPYEMALAIQDRMFKRNGKLFYPAFPGDPAYDDFITQEGVVLTAPEFPADPGGVFPSGQGGGPTALAEFFGDHMVVNGKIWPKANVERRNYRLRLLNGCDSRFMVLQFRRVPLTADDPSSSVFGPIPFDVIGSDQGLASRARRVTKLVMGPGERYDVVINFRRVGQGERVILSNEGWDEPFGGDYGRIDLGPGGGVATPGAEIFIDSQTDRIMAFDVVNTPSGVEDTYDRTAIGQYGGNTNPVDYVRKVALFEGKDEYGRLQPLLGIVHPGRLNSDGSQATPFTWANPDTELPLLNTTERWDIYNFTPDAHPVHLHLVNFQILGRRDLTFTSDDGTPGQTVTMHNGALGTAPVITGISVGAGVPLRPADGYVENAPKDMVTALPDTVTRIKATFDKPGKYVWHCHILSHEDHEMMRVMRVV